MSEVLATETPEPTALYRVWGDAGLLLYIGVSNDFGRRWKEHAKQQPWWDEMKRLTADEWFGSRPEAEVAEEAAIKAEKPKYNKRHLVPVERKSRKARTVALPARSAVMPAPAAAVAVLPPATRGRDDESCKVPYPYSLLSFAIPGHDMNGIDLSTPDGRFQAAKAFSAYEKEALEIRGRLDKCVAEILEMERDPGLCWAIPALRKIRQNYMSLIGDGSSLATGRDVSAAAVLFRETAGLLGKLIDAMGAVADALEAIEAIGELHEDAA